jgi:VanZ family protein
VKKRILTTLIALNLALIWGNSLVSGENSGALSGGMLTFLGRFLPVLMTELGHTLLRKAAHFCEFALLGLLYGGRHALVRGNVPLSLMGFGLAVACIDETIQVFTPGRASSLIDVWIDSAGFALGIVMIYIAYTMKTKSQSEI